MKYKLYLVLVTLIFSLTSSCQKEDITNSSTHDNVRSISISSLLSDEITPMSNRRVSNPSSMYETSGYTLRLVDEGGHEYIQNNVSIGSSVMFEDVVGEATIFLMSDGNNSYIHSSYYLGADPVIIPASSSIATLELYNKEWAFVEVYGAMEDVSDVLISNTPNWDIAQGQVGSLLKVQNDEISYYSFINVSEQYGNEEYLKIFDTKGTTQTQFTADVDNMYTFELLSEVEGNDLEINMNINPGFDGEIHNDTLPLLESNSVNLVAIPYNSAYTFPMGFNNEGNNTFSYLNQVTYEVDGMDQYVEQFYVNDTISNLYYGVLSIDGNPYALEGSYTRQANTNPFYIPTGGKLTLNESDLTYKVELPILDTLYLIGDIDSIDWEPEQAQIMEIDKTGEYFETTFTQDDEFKVVNFKFLSATKYWNLSYGENPYQAGKLMQGGEANNFRFENLIGTYKIQVNRSTWEVSVIQINN